MEQLFDLSLREIFVALPFSRDTPLISSISIFVPSVSPGPSRLVRAKILRALYSSRRTLTVRLQQQPPSFIVRFRGRPLSPRAVIAALLAVCRYRGPQSPLSYFLLAVSSPPWAGSGILSASSAASVTSRSATPYSTSRMTRSPTTPAAIPKGEIMSTVVELLTPQKTPLGLGL